MSPWQWILGIVTGGAAIITGLVYLVKRADWSFSKTQDQVDQDIQSQVDKERQEAEDTGRPI